MWASAAVRWGRRACAEPPPCLANLTGDGVTQLGGKACHKAHLGARAGTRAWALGEQAPRAQTADDASSTTGASAQPAQLLSRASRARTRTAGHPLATARSRLCTVRAGHTPCPQRPSPTRWPACARAAATRWSAPARPCMEEACAPSCTTHTRPQVCRRPASSRAPGALSPRAGGGARGAALLLMQPALAHSLTGPRSPDLASAMPSSCFCFSLTFVACGGVRCSAECGAAGQASAQPLGTRGAAPAALRAGSHAL